MDSAAALTPPPAAPDAAQLAAGITEAWARWLQREQRPSAPHASVYASAWRACERRMVYELVVPEQQPPFDASALARFRRGNDRERDLLMDLARIGRDADAPFDVIGQQERFALRDRKGRTAITGKVDARIYFSGGRSKGAPLELKAWSPLIVDRIESFADLFANPWTRSGAHQLLAYLYGANEPVGFLLLDRSGLPLILPVELDAHLDAMEDFLSRAERALDHVETGTLPPFFPEAVECKRCPFYGSVCNPPLAARDVQVLTDPELEPLLERWHALKPAGKEWADLDAALKKRLRGIENGIAGHFAISGAWSKSSRVELPEALRKQFTISDPRGRFTLAIERL